MFDKSPYEDTSDRPNLVRYKSFENHRDFFYAAPEHPFVTCYQNRDLLVIINAGVATE